MKYIGIMSGTSLDGIDAVICEFSEDNQVQLIAKCSLPFEPQLQTDLQKLLRDFTLHLRELGELEVRLAINYAAAVAKLLDLAKLEASDITAIGCHGQTVYHDPYNQSFD